MDTTKQKLQGGQLAVWLASQHHPINFALAARIRGAVAPEEVQQALDKLRRKHPPLSVRAAREADGNVYLTPDATLKIPARIVERKHTENWVEEVIAELDRAFDLRDGPPLRVVLLRGEGIAEVLFVCPHALADGLAVAYLVRDFLSFLADPEADETPGPPARPMSELIPDFQGKSAAIWRARLKAKLMKLALSRTAKAGAAHADEASQGVAQYHLHPWVLTSEQTAALVARSRTEGATVHAALCAAFLRAFGEFHRDGWKRRIQSPVNLRERLDEPVGKAFGLYVNLVEFPVNCAPERSFWEVAREIKQGFAHHTADKRIFDALVEANEVMNEVGAIITPQTVARSFIATHHDLSISNLGRLDFPAQYGSLRLEALFGPILGGDPQDIVLGVVTVGGKMHLCLSCTSLKLDPSQAEQIITTAMHWLANAT